MPYLYCCDKCYKKYKEMKGKGEDTAADFNGYAYTAQPVEPYAQPRDCPNCGTVDGMKYLKKLSDGNIKNTAKSLDIGEIRSLDVMIKSRGRMRTFTGKKSYNVEKYYDSMEIEQSKEEKKDDLAAKKAEETDPEFEPAKNFNPAMRYTTGSYSGRARNLTLYDPNHEKDSKLTQVAGAANRPVATSVAMAAALKATIGSRPQISAYSWVNWNKLVKRGKPFKTSPKESFEWCHLVADCLGGPTDVSNLVAASYCANTFMLVIEQKLQSKTDLKVQVVVDCSEPHVAEFIRYTVHKGNKSKEWVIDARAIEFSASDGKTYGDEVADFLK